MYHDTGSLNKHVENFFSGIDNDDFNPSTDEGGISFGFGSEFDIKKDVKNGKGGGADLFEGDGSDDEDRKFFEALASGFSQRGQQISGEGVADAADPFEMDDLDDDHVGGGRRNDMMDDTRATRKLIEA